MLQDFLLKYFVNPIAADSGYNMVNTMAFGIILVLLLVPLSRLLERLKIELDLKFYMAMVPLLLLGSSARVLVDLGFYQRMIVHLTPVLFFDLLISPGIYFLVFAPAIAAILLAYLFREKWSVPEYKTIAAASTAFFLLTHAFLYSSSQPAAFGFNIFSTALIIVFAALFCGLFYLAAQYFPNYFQHDFFTFFRQKIPFLLVATHLYDASTTFVGMQFYGFWEKHVIPSLVIGIFGPFSMFFLKLLVVPAVVYLLRDLENKAERNLIYFAIFVLGFAPGTRNLLLALLVP